jgi:hypothetical protein
MRCWHDILLQTLMNKERKQLIFREYKYALEHQKTSRIFQEFKRILSIKRKSAQLSDIIRKARLRMFIQICMQSITKLNGITKLYNIWSNIIQKSKQSSAQNTLQTWKRYTSFMESTHNTIQTKKAYRLLYKSYTLLDTSTASKKQNCKSIMRATIN